MPFGPIVPDVYCSPPVGPSYHKRAQSILIVDVHTVFVHTGLTTSVGGGPGAQVFTGIWISKGYCVQCFGRAKIRYGHLMQRLIRGSRAGHLIYIASKIVVNIHTFIIKILGYLVV